MTQEPAMDELPHAVRGSCHCGNLSFVVHTRIPPEDIRARACDCSFCRIHAARNWSDPDGGATIRVLDEQRLYKYRFALRTADFYICTTCGAYLGAVLADDTGTWSTLNLRLTTMPVDEEIASYGAEDVGGRLERRKRVWTPTVVHVGSGE